MSNINPSMLEVLKDAYALRSMKYPEMTPKQQKAYWALQWFYTDMMEIPEKYHCDIWSMAMEALVILRKLHDTWTIEHYPMLSEQFKDIHAFNADIRTAVSTVDDKFIGTSIMLFSDVSLDTNFNKLRKQYMTNEQDVYFDIITGRTAFSFLTVADTFEEFINEKD